MLDIETEEDRAPGLLAQLGMEAAQRMHPFAFSTASTFPLLALLGVGYQPLHLVAGLQPAAGVPALAGVRQGLQAGGVNRRSISVSDFSDGKSLPVN